MRDNRSAVRMSRTCYLSALGNMRSVRRNAWKGSVPQPERPHLGHFPLNVSPRVDVAQLLGLGASTGQNAWYLQRTVWNVLDTALRSEPVRMESVHLARGQGGDSVSVGLGACKLDTVHRRHRMIDGVGAGPACVGRY